MPRPWVETVEDYSPYQEAELYAARVGAIERDRSSIRVTLEHISEDQAGRTCVHLLPRPIRPGGPAAAFFRACGFEVGTGNSLAPRDAIGRAVGVRFSQAADGSWVVAAFERIMEHSDGEKKT